MSKRVARAAFRAINGVCLNPSSSPNHLKILRSPIAARANPPWAWGSLRKRIVNAWQTMGRGRPARERRTAYRSREDHPSC